MVGCPVAYAALLLRRVPLVAVPVAWTAFGLAAELTLGRRFGTRLWGPALAALSAVAALLVCDLALVWLVADPLVVARSTFRFHEDGAVDMVPGLLAREARPGDGRIVEYRIGASGFRGLDETGEGDLVALGDSCTFGAGVDERDGWPSRLGRALGRRARNLGVSGTCPPQQARTLLRHLRTAPAPLATVWMLYAGNDLAETGRFLALRAMARERFGGDVGAAFRAEGNDPVRRFRTGGLLRRLWALRGSGPAGPEPVTPDSREAVVEALKLVAAAPDAGSVVVAVLPARWGVDEAHRVLVASARGVGFPVLDLSEVLPHGGRGGRLPGDDHLDEGGSVLVAAAVARTLAAACNNGASGS